MKTGWTGWKKGDGLVFSRVALNPGQHMEWMYRTFLPYSKASILFILL